MNAILKKLDQLESIVVTSTGNGISTPFGLYEPSENGPKLVKTIKHQNGKWIETDENPRASIPIKLEPVLTRPKRFIIIIGGRGSGKSQTVGQICVVDMHDRGIKTACFREFQNSIDDSVQSLLANQIRKIGLDGFSFTNTSVKSSNGAEAKFKGLARNPDSMKSMDGFKRFWTEEAQATSENSLKLLTPTMREEGGSMIFTANPASSEDPFSKRFITPFREVLDRDGIYEDELHLIIDMNYTDNPWFPNDLDQERKWDHANLPRALYDHIWMGQFNDSIPNGLIMSEWFDACIDAHEKLGFKARGIKKVTHDPSDQGPDPKAISLRHGNVIEQVEEREDLDVNEGMDWATDYAVQNNADQFEYDVGGMGAGLKRQANTNLDGTHVDVYQFNGASSPDMADAIYQPAIGENSQQQKTNKEVFRNLRAQCYASLRDRVYLTYRAIVHGEICDPELLISFSSNIKHIGKLRSELCRIPIKPNGSGLFELYTKDTMRSKFKLSSPNLSDCVMMSERIHIKQAVVQDVSHLHIGTRNHW